MKINNSYKKWYLEEYRKKCDEVKKHPLKTPLVHYYNETLLNWS